MTLCDTTKPNIFLKALLCGAFKKILWFFCPQKEKATQSVAFSLGLIAADFGDLTGSKVALG